MSEKAEDLAFGRWPDILVARGMSDTYFRKSNGPCPFCTDGGGRDRYRWKNDKYGGVWVCSVCTEGKYASGMNMLMRHLGCTFREAADSVRSYFGQPNSVAPIPRGEREAYSNVMTPEKMQKNYDKMVRTLKEARALEFGDPVMQYLGLRVPGLDFIPAGVYYHPALPYYDPPEKEGERPKLRGKYPAMLSECLAPDGSLAQLHKTYLTLDGHKADVPLAKKTDVGLGLNSFAVRLLEPIGDTLGIGEGIETAAAGAMLRNIPVWSALNGTSLARFELPPYLIGQIKTLVIFEDHDELKVVGKNDDGSPKMRRAGSYYAQMAAERARKSGLRVLIIKPAAVGNDLADHWVKVNQPA